MTPSGPRRLSSREHALVIAGASLATLVLNWPAPLTLRTEILGAQGDAWQVLWNYWYLAEHLAREGSWPLETSAQFHPTGAPLVLHSFSPLGSALALPLLPLVGLVGAYNVLALLSFVLAAWFAWMLARELGCGHGGAAVAAWASSALPFHFAHIWGGHVHIAAYHWLILFFLFWVRVARYPGFAHGIGAAFALAASCLTSWYLALLALLGALFLTPPLLAEARSRRALERLFCAGLGGVALSLPMLLPVLAWRSAIPFAKRHSAWYWSADLQNLAVAPAVTRLGNSAPLRALSKAWTGNDWENVAYLGISVTALALLGLVLGPARRLSAVLIAAAVAFTALCLGPHLHWAGEVNRELTLPFAWLETALPLVKLSGVPARLVLGANLCLALAAGLGTHALANRLSAPKARAAAALAMLGLVAAELWPKPAVRSRQAVPPVAAEIRDDPRQPGAVLDTREFGRALYLATQHERPLVYGHLARHPEFLDQRFHELPVVARILRPRSPWVETQQRSVDAAQIELDAPHPSRGELRGTLQLSEAGDYVFTFRGNARRAAVDVGGHRALTRGPGPKGPRGGRLPLRAGRHPIELRVESRRGAVNARLEIAPAAPESQATATLTDLTLTHLAQRNDSGLGRDAALRVLRALGVAWIIRAPRQDRSLERHELGLKPHYQDRHMVVFRVP